MIGTSMDELKDRLIKGHEAEFTYKDIIYVIQPEVLDNKSYLVIWNCGKDSSCICRYSIPQGIIPQDLIDKVFNEKCFDGKSFYEIEADVTVETIF